MSNWPQISLSYDGSFAGFLCCLAHCFHLREYPYFFSADTAQATLYPLREIATDLQLSKKVYLDLRDKLSLSVRQMVEQSFLTALPSRERYIFDYLYACTFSGILRDSSDERVLVLERAVHELHRECKKWEGAIRFSDYKSVLLAEIQPQGRVLPLLRRHLCARMPNEVFLVHDRIHKEALCSAKGRWKILPFSASPSDAPDAREIEMRALWKQFYHCISIEARKNQSVQQAHARALH